MRANLFGWNENQVRSGTWLLDVLLNSGLLSYYCRIFIVYHISQNQSVHYGITSYFSTLVYENSEGKELLPRPFVTFN